MQKLLVRGIIEPALDGDAVVDLKNKTKKKGDAAG